jgi:hypothetical protein
MSLVAVVKAKAGGTTTAVLAMASVWPAARRLLIAELDPAGGDLAARFGMPAEPGLMTLAAAARRDLSDDAVWQHAQALPGGTPVLVAPPAAEQCHAALRALGGRLAAMVAADPSLDVLADCGRLDPDSPALDVVQRADVVVFVARPTAEEVAHLRARVASVRPPNGEVGIVLIGEKPYPSREVVEAVGLPVFGVLADDSRSAEYLAGRSGSRNAFKRSPLVRSATAVVDAIRATLDARQAPAPAKLEGLA